MDSTLIINGVVIALLAATIFYAFRLERKLEAMRSAQAAFGDIVRELNRATARAEAGIQGLRATAETSGHSLDDKIKRARSVCDELGILVQAGQRLGQRIETMRPAGPVRTQSNPAGEALRALGGLR
ncbi:MAG: hypothetical protein KBA31_12695 [Alphaproteobacteria bacterium]|nr:hypothetical protein [Alphaproteobacteria bacterium]